jgi:hypothetical protein
MIGGDVLDVAVLADAGEPWVVTSGTGRFSRLYCIDWPRWIGGHRDRRVAFRAAVQVTGAEPPAVLRASRGEASLWVYVIHSVDHRKGARVNAT